MQSLGRIPTLDGWRCVAISMVVFMHGYSAYFPASYARYPFLHMGPHGVAIFFVLSGYLITTTLLESGRIDLIDFYLRRFFRLMPAAWGYLACVCVLNLLAPIHQFWGGIISCIFFYRNIFPANTHTAFTVHFWSLSVEEQFYLVWPFLLARVGKIWSTVLAAVSVIAIMMIRSHMWNAFLGSTVTWVRADSILIGCLLAIAVRNNRSLCNWFSRFAPWIFGVCGCLFLADLYYFQLTIPTHENLLIALLIGATVRRPRMMAGRLLEIGVVKSVGKLAYSIYLWHVMFALLHWGVISPILCVGFVLLSWFCIEKPCIAWGARLRQRRKRSAQTPSLVTPFVSASSVYHDQGA